MGVAADADHQGAVSSGAMADTCAASSATSALCEMDTEDPVLVTLDGEVLEPGKTPSKEWRWHPGPVGLMTVQACKQLGARQVILVGTRQSRLDVGGRLGADHLVNVNDVDVVKRVLDLTDGGAHLVIETSGGTGTPQQCAQTVARGGRILFVAFYPGPVTFDLSSVVRKDVTMFTTRGEGGNNVQRAVALAEQGRLRGEELVTHEFPLEQITEAMRVMRERDGDPLKVAITF